VKIQTSARRYEALGPLRTSLFYLLIMILYCAHTKMSILEKMVRWFSTGKRSLTHGGFSRRQWPTARDQAVTSFLIFSSPECDNIRTDNEHLQCRTAVRERYAAGAKTAESKLCCPVDYENEWLKVIPQEVIERDYRLRRPQ